jgi:hypothetical protein
MLALRSQFVRSIFSALLLAFALSTYAADTAGEDSSQQGWRKKRAEIFAQIEQEVKEQAENTVTLENAAASLRIQLPVTKPQKNTREIFSETRQAADKAALAAKPLKELQLIVAEAERLYPLYQIGDQVSIRTRIKAYPLATGIVAAISTERVRIGSRWIPLKDIAEEQRNGFDAVKTMDLRQNYAARQNNLQMAILRNASDEIFHKTLPQNMRQGGYYPDDDEEADLSSPESWLNAESVLQEELIRLRKETASKLRPEIEKRMFAENGFKYYESKKEWRPTGFLQSLKNLFD